ncbi:MAG TPA: hypothetical protein VEA69_20335, partial [Tepidisphaeraceae bacterium]|nr:hypothetical protein [Tepidisphaeraceae bacterium]
MGRLGRIARVCAGVMAALGVAAGAGAKERTTVVARTGSGVPNTPSFSYFSMPAISDRGEVAFLSSAGIYHASGAGALTRLTGVGSVLAGAPAGTTVDSLGTWYDLSVQPLNDGRVSVNVPVKLGGVTTTPTRRIPAIFTPGAGVSLLAVPGQPIAGGTGTWPMAVLKATVSANGKYVAVHDQSYSVWRGTSAADLKPVTGLPTGVAPIVGAYMGRDGNLAVSMYNLDGGAGRTFVSTPTGLVQAGPSVIYNGTTQTFPQASAVRLDGHGRYLVYSRSTPNVAVGSAAGGPMTMYWANGRAASGNSTLSFTPNSVRFFDGQDNIYLSNGSLFVGSIHDPSTMRVLLQSTTPVVGGGMLGTGMYLVNRMGQVLIANSTAVHGYDESLGVVSLLKAGDQVEISPGVTRTVSRFSETGFETITYDGYDDGRPRSLNDMGEVVVQAYFTDNSMGIIKTRIPVAGDATADGLVDFSDYAILRKNFGGVGDRSKGDFDGDGR